MGWVRPVLYLGALLTLVAFPFGPLFPWSPLTPGYDRLRLARADILYPQGANLDPAYREVDQFIAEAEQFHDLKMPKRVTIVACRHWSDFRRFVPQIRGNAVGAVTIQTGTVIYVTPKLDENHLDVGEFLRHELSHAALHQNQNLLQAFELEREQWFCEGLAVLFGRQRSYITAAEFTVRAMQDDIAPVFDGSGQRDMRLAYQVWRYFLAYLRETRGQDRFLTLEHGCMDRPRSCREVFAEVYGQGLPAAVAEFQDAVRTGRFGPAD